MRKFKHYNTIRFNVGIYSPDARIRIPPEQWMRFLFFNLDFYMPFEVFVVGVREIASKVYAPAFLAQLG
jgi:hypothetical protein